MFDTTYEYDMNMTRAFMGYCQVLASLGHKRVDTKAIQEETCYKRVGPSDPQVTHLMIIA